MRLSHAPATPRCSPSRILVETLDFTTPVRDEQKQKSLGHLFRTVAMQCSVAYMRDKPNFSATAIRVRNFASNLRDRDVMRISPSVGLVSLETKVQFGMGVQQAPRDGLSEISNSRDTSPRKPTVNGFCPGSNEPNIESWALSSSNLTIQERSLNPSVHR